MYIIGFNGPPRCGKDSIANMLAAKVEDSGGLQPQLLSLSTPMRKRAFELIGQEYSVTRYEQIKDVPQDLLLGKTIREAMILDSEQSVKVNFGHDFWSRRQASAIWPHAQLVLITDIGFIEEVNYFTELVGHKNFVTVQLHRPGIEWKNDSRSYVCGNQCIVSHNDSTIERCAESILAELEVGFGWEI